MNAGCRVKASIRWICLLYVIAALCGLAITGASDNLPVVQASGAGMQERLELGKPIERQIGEGEAHAFTLKLEAGEFVHVFVYQHGVNVVVSLIAPDGKRLLDADTPVSTQEAEWLTHIAGTAGEYRLEVRAVEKGAAAGAYEIKVEEQRKATAEDEKRVAAEAAFVEGTRLYSEKKDESYRQAVKRYKEALILYRTLGRRVEEAAALTCVSRAYYSLRDYQATFENYTQALEIYRNLKDRHGEGFTLNGLGNVSQDLYQYDKAIAYYEQAVAARREVKYRAGEAGTLSNLGQVYWRLNRNEKAIEYYAQALAIQREVKDRREEATILSNLMLAWKKIAKPRVAIFYGKQAVNAYQEIRGNIKTLEKQSQQSYLASVEQTYRSLAELLIAENRLLEAHQVIDLLKQEEYFQFVRRDRSVSPATAQAEYRPDEAQAKEKEDSVTAIGTRLAELEAKALRADLTAEEEQQRARYASGLEAAEREFLAARDVLAREVRKADISGNEVINRIEQERALMSALREIGNTVALYTLVGEEKYYVILMTPQTRVAREYPIKAADLRKKVFAFGEALQNPKADPLPFAQELYNILVAPVAKDIEGAKSRPDETLTLMWELDGVLRYVPIAALHDGSHYLVERFRNVVYTPASKTSLKDAVSTHWKALGLGVSKPHTVDADQFPALPAVPAELRSIIHDEAARPSNHTAGAGVLPGRTMLDEAFTAEALKGVRLRYQLLHIASHFQFRPGDETKSYLLLGDGSPFTLAQLRLAGMIFDGVDLLTLSACNTAVGDKDANGRETEGFGVMAQQQGAKAVVASLWPVTDESTRDLMSEFYRRHETMASISKAEALRQAQLTLLHGSMAAAPTGAGQRGPQPKSRRTESKTNLSKDWSHPYYWAAFILIGNFK